MMCMTVLLQLRIAPREGSSGQVATWRTVRGKLHRPPASPMLKQKQRSLALRFHTIFHTSISFNTTRIHPYTLIDLRFILGKTAPAAAPACSSI
jgi:hypothetical protein